MLPRPALLPLVLRGGLTNTQSGESSLRRCGGNMLRWIRQFIPNFLDKL